MLYMKLVVLNFFSKPKKILFAIIFCLTLILISSNTKSLTNKVSVVAEEELINLALDHNQCIGDGHVPETHAYKNCMEQLQYQRSFIVSI